MASIAEMFGRLHPVLIHFPISLLWVGALLEIVRVRRESPFTARAAVWVFGAGATLAIGAAATGWVLASYEHVRSDERATLELHRWWGIATAIFACLTWAAAKASRESATTVQTWVRRLCAWSTVILVTVASHLGATIVWGKDWFSFGSH